MKSWLRGLGSRPSLRTCVFDRPHCCQPVFAMCKNGELEAWVILLMSNCQCPLGYTLGEESKWLWCLPKFSNISEEENLLLIVCMWKMQWNAFFDQGPFFPYFPLCLVDIDVIQNIPVFFPSISVTDNKVDDGKELRTQQVLNLTLFDP